MNQPRLVEHVPARQIVVINLLPVPFRLDCGMKEDVKTMRMGLEIGGKLDVLRAPDSNETRTALFIRIVLVLAFDEAKPPYGGSPSRWRK